MLTDSGTTVTYLPSAMYDELVSEICKDRSCIQQKERGTYYVEDCGDVEDFPPVWLQLDTHWYKWSPSQYLLYINLSFSYRWLCELRFKRALQDDYGTLGINFLDSYAHLHDMTLNQQCIKPVPNDGSFLDATG